MFEFKLPEVGENIESGTIISIAVAVGDSVKKDQDLLELETDKASLPVPSPIDGVIKEILIKEGDDVKIGQVVMTLDSDGSATVPQKKETIAKEEKAKPEAPAKITQEQTPEPQAPSALSAPESKSDSAVNAPAAPSVRRLARELGVAIENVPGTGIGERISKDDVKAYTKNIVSSDASTDGSTAAAASRPLPDFSKWGEVKREGMKKIRQVTADHLSYCWQTIPHVTQFGQADITGLEKLRKKLSTKDRKLSVTPFLLKVMGSALKKFPQFNASIDMATKEIIYKSYVNLGVAVDTDNGLLVPVIRDIDQKNIIQINDELISIAEKARDRKVSLENLKGGSMTLTNLGGIGGTSFTPVVNWPEVAILGVSRGGWEPVYENNQFVPRFKLPLSLSYDHRIIDGADGARFLMWICEAIEQPFMLELEK